MERVVTGVTLDTLPQAVRRAGLKPGQRFTITVEDEDAGSRAEAIAAMQDIARRVGARVAADNLTEDDVMRLLETEDEEARQQQRR